MHQAQFQAFYMCQPNQSSHQPSEIAVIIPILEMRKLRPRKVKKSIPALKSSIQNLNPLDFGTNVLNHTGLWLLCTKY